MNWEKIELKGDAHDFSGERSVEGKYVSMRDNVGPNNSNIYTLEKDDGTLVSVWGSTVIDNQMQYVPKLARVKIEYMGKVTSDKTKREYKDFSVSIWKGENDEIPQEDKPPF